MYLIDQSGSMISNINYDKSKAEMVADSVNEVIYEAGIRCYSSNGNMKNYFEFATIGYGGSDGTVEPAWEGNLRDRWVVSVAEVFQNAVGESNGVPIWVRPKAGRDTPMKKAFENAFRLCKKWIEFGNHMDCYPPIIINISDGEATDAGIGDTNLLNVVNDLKNLHTNYGHVNIFNIHISSEGGDSILFPTSQINRTNQAKLLFEISTELNPKMVALAKNLGYSVHTGSKGYIYNGSARNLMDFLKIGSTPI